MWEKPQADFSQIHLADWRIIARDKTADLVTILSLPERDATPNQHRTGLSYDTMFVVLDERQKAATCQNYQAKT